MMESLSTLEKFHTSKNMLSKSYILTSLESVLIVNTLKDIVNSKVSVCFAHRLPDAYRITTEILKIFFFC